MHLLPGSHAVEVGPVVVEVDSLVEERLVEERLVEERLVEDRPVPEYYVAEERSHSGLAVLAHVAG